jgi:hypothetical protein
MEIGGASGDLINLANVGMDVLKLQQAWYKTYGATLRRRSLHASSRTTTKQPCTLSVAVVGCSTGILVLVWAQTLRVDRGMDGFRGPSGAQFVVCSLLVLGPKHQNLVSRRFWPQKRLRTERLDEKRLGNGWVIVPHNTNHRRWSTVGGVEGVG